MIPRSCSPPAPPGTSEQPARSAIVLGAGLAGVALTRALTDRGWSVTLIDDADAQAGSRQRALAVHPAHAPDASPASRLTRIALTLLQEDAQSGQRAPSEPAAAGGPAVATPASGWIARGRLQLMAADRARRLVQSWPDGPLDSVGSQAAAQRCGLDGLDGLDGFPGTGGSVGPSESEPGGLWWSIPSAVDPALLLMRWLHEAGQSAAAHGQALNTVRSSIHSLHHDGRRWIVSKPDLTPLAEAPVAIICLGARSADLNIAPRAAMPFSLDPSASDRRSGGTVQPDSALWQAAGWQQASGQCARSQQPVARLSAVLGRQGSGHVLPLGDGHLLRGPIVKGPIGRGPIVKEPTALRPLEDTQGASLLSAAMAAAKGFEALDTGWRASVRDHLPLAGAWPDLNALREQWPALARNARLPLPRLNGLWTLSALGGRGLLWALPAAEHLAAMLSGETSPLDARLSNALDPARFLRRALRAGVPDLTQALGLA